MGAAVVALIVLVVLPLLFLLIGSVRGPEGLSLDHFSEVLSGRLYVNALRNSLILGAWTALFSLIIGLHAGLGGEPHRRAGEAVPPGHRDAVLSAAAVPDRDRLHLSVQPQCRADQRLDARRAGTAVAHLQHLLDAGPRPGDGDAHVSVRVSPGLERAAVGRRLLRGSRADPRRQQAAHRVLDHGAAGGAGDPVRHAARLRQRHRAVRLAGDHRAARPHRDAADPHLCAVRLSARIRARLRAVAGVRAPHRRRALSAALVPGAALLRDARRQGLAAAD